MYILGTPDELLPLKHRGFFDSRSVGQLQVTVQGKFKHPPQGTFYLGIESGQALELNWFKKKLVSVLHRICQSMARDMILTFDDTTVNNSPLIVYPAFQMADVSIETPPDETPPSIFDVHKSRPNIDRDTVSATYPVNVANTYSVSFYSDNMDFWNWKVVNIPAVSDISLDGLIGEESFIRILAYDHLPAADKESPTSHHLHRRDLVFSCRILDRDGIYIYIIYYGMTIIIYIYIH